ncbi:MAG: hypothetical protein KJO94_08245 [Eudoraea sp.]|nr:hypothetical protein [Eudoraea sp.]MBT8312716.1 hypothetical protein [Eudoraea sp.]MBT8323454.1 hypothetical protein [Eudoraea sp.]NNJ39132.1 hypothetical protein [Flavobacteriaceae bacterium]NNJ40421.1 hypothetical protein [Eudoraea sp.]
MGTKPRYIEWISPEEMHSATLAWLSELKFIKDEQRFLNGLVKSYTEQLINHKIYDKSKQLVGEILDAENELDRLLKKVQVHENQLEIMIDDVDQPKMEKAYRETHLELLQLMQGYLEDYRDLKTQLFNLLTRVIKQEKQKRLLN